MQNLLDACYSFGAYIPQQLNYAAMDDPDAYYVSGVAMSKDIASTAGNKFAFETLEASRARYKSDRMDKKISGGTANHTLDMALTAPDGSVSRLETQDKLGECEKIVLMCVDLHWEGDYLCGTFKILNSALCRDLIANMLSGYRYFVSVHGAGEIQPNGYVTNFEIYSFDLVSDGADRAAIMLLHKGVKPGEKITILNSSKKQLNKELITINTKIKQTDTTKGNSNMKQKIKQSDEFDMDIDMEMEDVDQSAILPVVTTGGMTANDALNAIAAIVAKVDSGMTEIDTDTQMSLLAMGNKKLMSLASKIVSLKQNTVSEEAFLALAEGLADVAEEVIEALDGDDEKKEGEDGEDAIEDDSEDSKEDELFEEIEASTISQASKKKLAKSVKKLINKIKQNAKAKKVAMKSAIKQATQQIADAAKADVDAAKAEIETLKQSASKPEPKNELDSKIQHSLSMVDKFVDFSSRKMLVKQANVIKKLTSEMNKVKFTQVGTPSPKLSNGIGEKKVKSNSSVEKQTVSRSSGALARADAIRQAALKDVNARKKEEMKKSIRQASLKQSKADMKVSKDVGTKTDVLAEVKARREARILQANQQKLASNIAAIKQGTEKKDVTVEAKTFIKQRSEQIANKEAHKEEIKQSVQTAAPATDECPSDLVGAFMWNLKNMKM